jgi:hypothetical protein
MKVVVSILMILRLIYNRKFGSPYGVLKDTVGELG